MEFLTKIAVIIFLFQEFFSFFDMLKIIDVVYYGDEKKWGSPTKKWHFLTILCLILIKNVYLSHVQQLQSPEFLSIFAILKIIDAVYYGDEKNGGH